jgi:hypothetical protein
MFPIVRRAGRWVVIFLVLSYFGSIWVGSHCMPYYVFWRQYLLVTTSQPAFLDTHNFTSAMDCSRLGYDVLRLNPCEPNKVAMTYPRIWLGLKWMGIRESHSTSMRAPQALWARHCRRAGGAKRLFAFPIRGPCRRVLRLTRPPDRLSAGGAVSADLCEHRPTPAAS